MRRRASIRCAVVLTVAGLALSAQAAFGQTDVNKVLADARQALGGEKKLQAVKTVSVTGKSLRTMPTGSTMEGDFEMALELPDKFVRRDVLAAMGNMSVYRLSGFNGEGLINETDTPPQLSTGNVVMHVRMAGPGGDPATMTPEQKEAARLAMLQSAKRDFSRLALGMLLQPLASYPLTFTYGGTAESPDGVADVVNVKGEGLEARLFIDSKTHLPLMLSWMDKEPLRIVRQVGGPGGAAAGGAGGGTTANVMVMGSGGGGAGAGSQPAAGQAPKLSQMTPEEREKVEQQMAEQVRAAQAQARTVEFRLYYADYQEVDGVMLPRRIQSSVDGRPTEEITLEKVKLNQKIDAKRFAVSK